MSPARPLVSRARAGPRPGTSLNRTPDLDPDMDTGVLPFPGLAYLRDTWGQSLFWGLRSGMRGLGWAPKF